MTPALPDSLRAHARLLAGTTLAELFARDATRVQRLTWEAYMNKKLVRARPAAHARIFFKDVAHLLGFVSP